MLTFVESDRDRIIQILSNLLSNSIKFRNQGEISINLFEKIKDKADGKTEVLVSLTDKGSRIIVKFLEGYFQNLLQSQTQVLV
jgi:signal transduction histidine kinase